MASLSRHTVGVMGSGRDEHSGLAEPLGALLARMEVNLLTGGGRGVMTSVSRAYLAARQGAGISIGVLMCASDEERQRPPDGYPNPFVEFPIHTHLPQSGDQGQSDLSRNHINVLNSDAIVMLPGRSGTASEAALALRYDKPAIAFGNAIDELANLDASIPRSTELAEVESFVRAVCSAAKVI